MRCASAAARKISVRSERSGSSHEAMYAASLVNSHSAIPSSAHTIIWAISARYPYGSHVSLVRRRSKSLMPRVFPGKSPVRQIRRGWGASGSRVIFCGGSRLLSVHPVGGLLRLARGGKDRAWIVPQHLEPGGDVASVVGPRLNTQSEVTANHGAE